MLVKEERTGETKQKKPVCEYKSKLQQQQQQQTNVQVQANDNNSFKFKQCAIK